MEWDGIVEAIQSIFTNEFGINLSSVLVFSFVIWAIAMIKMRKRNLIYKIFITLVIIYISKVIDYTILPLPLNAKAIEQLRNYFPFDVNYNINVTPFFVEYFKENGINSVIYDALNIIMFIPMGMIISFYSEGIEWKDVMKKSFFISLFIELSQLFLGLLIGSSNRISDINDLIMNTIGGIVGFIIFKKIIEPLYRKTFKGEEIYEIKN